jgi:hypothetical protein
MKSVCMGSLARPHAAQKKELTDALNSLQKKYDQLVKDHELGTHSLTLSLLTCTLCSYSSSAPMLSLLHVDCSPNGQQLRARRRD